MLAANPDLDSRSRLAAAFNRDPHELADAVDIDCLERVAREDSVLEVVRQEAPLRVVA